MIDRVNQSSSQVLIIGGSVSGLAAALFLAQRGTAVTLIEKRERHEVHPRARGFHERTIELFRPTLAGPVIEREGAVVRGSGGGILRALTLTSPAEPGLPPRPLQSNATSAPRLLSISVRTASSRSCSTQYASSGSMSGWGGSWFPGRRTFTASRLSSVIAMVADRRWRRNILLRPTARAVPCARA